MPLSDIEQNLLNKPAACLTTAKFLLANHCTSLANESDQYNLALFLLACANTLTDASKLAIQTLKQHPQWQALIQLYPFIAQAKCLISNHQLLAITKKAAIKLKAKADADLSNKPANNKADALETIIHEWKYLTFNDLLTLLQDTDVGQILAEEGKTTDVIPVGFLLITQENLSNQPSTQKISDLTQLAEELKRRQCIQATERRMKNLIEIQYALDSIAAVDDKFDALLVQLNLQQWIPAVYFCPLTKQILRDPITLHDGYTFEREAIVEHLKTSRTNPVTKLTLANSLFVPNLTLKKLISHELDTFAFLNQNQTEIPNYYQCPISYLMMTEPVIVNDGHTYEKEKIIRWCQEQRNNAATSPITREIIDIENAIPNLALQELIRGYLNSHPELYEEEEVYLPQAYQDLMYQAIMSRNFTELHRLASLDKRLLTHAINNHVSALCYLLNGQLTENEIIGLIKDYAIKVNLIKDLTAICMRCIQKDYQNLLENYLLTASTYALLKISDPNFSQILLAMAIYENNNSAIQLLLKLGANDANAYFMVLFYAAKKKDKELFNHLLNKKLDVKIKDEIGYSVLSYCISGETLNWTGDNLWYILLQYLIDEGLLANKSTLIHAAVYLEDLSALGMLIDYYLRLAKVNKANSYICGQDENGDTPLQLAVQKNNELFAQNLLKAYPEHAISINRKGESPLDIAIKKRYPKLTMLLVGNCKQLRLANLTSDDLSFLYIQINYHHKFDLILNQILISVGSLNKIEQIIAASRAKNISFSNCQIEFNALVQLIRLVSIQAACKFEFNNLQVINKPDVIPSEQLAKTREDIIRLIRINNNLVQTMQRFLLVALGLVENVSLAHLAAYLDDTLSLEKYDASIEAGDNHGNTPLHYAVKANSQLAIKYLLDKNPALAFKPNKEGISPIAFTYQNHDTQKPLFEYIKKVSYCPKTSKELVDLLNYIKNFTHLESLVLKDYTLSIDEFKQLIDTLFNLIKFKYLHVYAKELNIGFLNHAYWWLYRKPTENFNIYFDHFNLANQELTDIGWLEVILAMQKYHFKIINLSNTNLVSYFYEFKSFFHSKELKNSIEQIDISNNKLTEYQIIDFVNIFIKSNRTIKVFKLTGNQITTRAALELISAFKHNHQLEVLEVSKNQLNYPIRQAICHALQADVTKADGKLIFTRRKEPIFTGINAKHYLRKLQSEIKKTDWNIGFFGGEKVRLDGKKMVVPKGVRLMLDAMQEAQAKEAKGLDGQNTWMEAKNKIAAIAKDRKTTWHSFFNRQHKNTANFYAAIIAESTQTALTA